jgi:hypothetical protein
MARNRRLYSNYWDNIVIKDENILRTMRFSEKDGVVAVSLFHGGRQFPLGNVRVETDGNVNGLRAIRKNKLSEKICINPIGETKNFYITIGE